MEENKCSDESSSSGEEFVEESPMNFTSKNYKTFKLTPFKADVHGTSEPMNDGFALSTSKNLEQQKVLSSRKRPSSSVPNENAPASNKRKKLTEVDEKAIGMQKDNDSPIDTKDDDGEAKPKINLHIREKPFKEATKYTTEAIVQINSAFYENQREQYHALRQTSNVIFLRKFNNWVKSVLINITCHKKGKYLSVLDICCGKGGDLQKWFRNMTSHYVGVDLSENSVRNAGERFQKMRYKGKLPFHAIFMVNNVGDGKNSFLNYLDKRIYFDIVSCQMSMHYLCESEDTARSFLSNVSTRLVPGGFFIGTTLDSNVLVKKLRKVGLHENNKDKYTFGNQYYSAKFLQRDFPRKKPFGNKYLFYLEDGVGHKRANGTIEYVPEYLVIFKNFVKLAEKEYNLKLIKRENFHKFYQQNIEHPRNKTLFEKIVRPESFKKDLTKKQLEDQWDICYLYQTFTFQKVQGTRVEGTQGRCGREREDRFKFIDTTS